MDGMLYLTTDTLFGGQMSFWTNAHGIISVSVPGRSDAECRYIIETVLNHLPRVSGSEADLDFYYIRENGYDSSSNVDEFDEFSNLLDVHVWPKMMERGMHTVQHRYIIVFNGRLRDRFFDETFKDVIKWFTRLAKRIYVDTADFVVGGVDLPSYEYVEKRFYSGNLRNLYDFEDEWAKKLTWKFDNSD